jgi:putative transposase
MVSLVAKRHAASYLQGEYRVSERRACRVLDLPRSTKRRTPGSLEQTALVTRIHELSGEYPRFGYRKIFEKLIREGVRVGRERVRLIRKREGLQVPQKQRKRCRAGKSTTDEYRALYPNHVWSYDFMADQTADGRRLRFLTVIDEYTREALRIECGRFLNSHDVIRVLEELVESWGAPAIIKSDNGPELVAQRVQDWLCDRGIATRYIDPGSPWQNGHNESFNSVFRDGCLDRWIFSSVREARLIVESWRIEYNTERPHGALGGEMPAAYAAGLVQEDREAA